MKNIKIFNKPSFVKPSLKGHMPTTKKTKKPLTIFEKILVVSSRAKNLQAGYPPLIDIDILPKTTLSPPLPNSSLQDPPEPQLYQKDLSLKHKIITVALNELEGNKYEPLIQNKKEIIEDLDHDDE